MIENTSLAEYITSVLVFLKLLAAPILGFVTVLLRRAYQGKNKKLSVSICEAGLVAIAGYCIVPLFVRFNIDADMAYPFSFFLGVLGIDRASLMLTNWANKKLEDK